MYRLLFSGGLLTLDVLVEACGSWACEPSGMSQCILILGSMGLLYSHYRCADDLFALLTEYDETEWV